MKLDAFIAISYARVAHKAKNIIADYRQAGEEHIWKGHRQILLQLLKNVKRVMLGIVKKIKSRKSVLKVTSMFPENLHWRHPVSVTNATDNEFKIFFSLYPFNDY